MKKFYFLTVIAMLLFSVSASAVELNLNLNNPDVRKCLIESAGQEGWEHSATYLDADNKVVLVFSKDGKNVSYTGNQKFECEK
ncbi:hypothetical protein [Gaetbulibacter saemankumensis]|uniref:hypothetical protein n=1 Tax=Gaetbulibacter saemankumensis TaxID=311208 RepID=UPI00048087C9|nr:hypothetical protein [Gaetbulibacter saemankumensis]